MHDPTTGKVDSGIWTFAGLIFAASLIGFSGMFHILIGVSALLSSGYFDVNNDYAYRISTTLWGALQIGLGCVCIAAAISILSGKTWAIVFGIAMAAISAVGSFLSIPYHPIWSTLIIALDVLIIWTLAVHGPKAAA
ncbi:MAG: hypothetical protein GEU75_10900 [Dehalococcoidia bacterium]|nr:hypothetical protein [Dehalococcoidia bacterium]